MTSCTLHLFITYSLIWISIHVNVCCNTSCSFPHSWLLARITRRVPLVGQKLLTLPEHMSSPPVFSVVRVTRSLVLCVCFADRCLSFCTFFLLVIVLSVLLRCTDSGCLPLANFHNTIGELYTIVFFSNKNWWWNDNSGCLWYLLH